MVIHPVQHKLFGYFPLVRSFILDGEETLLFDSGLNSRSARDIEMELKKMGETLEDVSICFITHRHSDHIGGLKALRERGRFLTAVHSADADAVIKATGVKPEIILEDGVEVAGVKTIYLPGHTAGNVAFLVEGYLISGDTINGDRNRAKPPSGAFNWRSEMANESIKHLSSYPFTKVYPSHGEVVELSREAVTDLADSL
jgi:glyoxylase-like metal-dependent hydrolase (beta-lactamase superfamily II)